MTTFSRRQLMLLLDELGIEPSSPISASGLLKLAKTLLIRFKEPSWLPIETAPSDGRLFIAVDAKNAESISIGNWPAGYIFGRWTYDDHCKEWVGSGAEFQRWAFTHWRELPAQPLVGD